VPGFLDRRRAARLMGAEGIAVLVLCQPESLSYATGAFPGVATFWRRAGAAFLIVPADEHAPLTAIVGDLQARSFAAQSGISDVRSHRIWVETDNFPFDPEKPKRSPRPTQFDLNASAALLCDVLSERGLLKARIGLELGFVPAADLPAFTSLPFEWKDCSRIVERLRAIKHPEEIAKLRRAAQYSAAGISELLTSISPGMTAQQMTEIWKTAAIAEAQNRGEPAPQSAWAYIAVGGDGFAPGGPARQGDIIKIDVGCVIDGYSSDGARTAVLGEPSPAARKIFDAMHHAFDSGLALFETGRPLRDIYRATASAMWDQGFETYGRGHFGHGVGASVWSEEWPFISADADATLEPNMVLAFETPWYIDGVGGFIIEDQLLMTERGPEIMAPLPRGLARL
jgi:Xaa-Pro dipeptidase